MKTKSFQKIIANTKNQNIQIFFLFANSLLEEHGFRVILKPQKFLTLSRKDRNNKSTGYFCETEKEIVVAIDRPFKKWFENVFIHEFAHFIQWLNKAPALLDCDKNKSLEKIDDWVEKNCEMDDGDVANYIKKIKAMERECELIALELISIFDLPVDKKRYWRGALKYLRTYDYTRKKRKWKLINW